MARKYQREAAAAADGSTKEPALAPGKRTLSQALVYIGLTKGAATEGSYLDELNKDKGGAIVITPNFKGPDDQIDHEGRHFDLTHDDQVEAFVKVLGVPDESRGILLDVLQNNKGSRDELAKFAIVLNEAEHERRLLERVVLSGHNAADAIYGEHGEHLSFPLLVKLLAAFPKARSQVRHLMVATCSSGYAINIYQMMFPQIQTIWAYAGRSPGTWSGAAGHMKVWEKATEGDDVKRLNADGVKGMRRGEAVSTWDVETGDKVPSGEAEIEMLHAAISEGHKAFWAFRNGDRVVANHEEPSLRAYQKALLQMVGQIEKGNPLVNASLLPDLKRSAAQVIRMIYWKEIAAKFAETHGAAIKAALDLAGQKSPDLKKLSRNDLFQIADRLSKAKTVKGDAQREKTIDEVGRLLSGLIDLDPAVVPDTWIV